MYSYFQYLKQNISDHRPVVDRLNKTGSALLQLAGGDDSERLQSLIDDDNTRFDAVKNSARERSNSLDEALQQASEVIADFSGGPNCMSAVQQVSGGVTCNSKHRS